MSSEEKEKCGLVLYSCAELPVFSILTCGFFFDTRVSRVGNSFAGKSRQRGMNLSWPRSIASGLFPFPCWDLVVLLVVLPKTSQVDVKKEVCRVHSWFSACSHHPFFRPLY